MKSKWKLGCLSVVLLITLIGCGKAGDISKQTVSMENGVTIISSGKEFADAKIIVLSEDKVSIDGEEVKEYDYTWNCDPTAAHDEVENAPAEFYTGTKPDTADSIYLDHELYYFPLLEQSKFEKVNYDGEQEWAYYYSDGENEEYIFATLPNLGQNLPVDMMHSKEEAEKNKVLHITEAGVYVIKGSFKGQIKVDLGEDAATDPDASVKLILDGADIECSVAPAIIFENVYECDNAWEENERKDASVDTKEAGAVIELADASENYLSGQNVFRMLKTKYKDEDSKDEVKVQKKMRKTDGALYSYMSMNLDGSGKLTVDSGYEGIDSELHLTVNGGNYIVNSQDDGMNVNEDHTSVVSFLGGEVTLNAALGAEGDGVDSNGFILVDGGIINVNGIRVPDSALDSEDGIYYNSGKVFIDGQEQTYTSGSIFKETRNEDLGPNGIGERNDFGPGGFGDMEGRPDFDLKEFKEKVAALEDDATYEDVLELLEIRRNEDMPKR